MNKGLLVIATCAVTLALFLAVCCSAAECKTTPIKEKSSLEYSFDVWDWTAPAQDLNLFDKWAADMKSIGMTRVEMSAPWSLLEPEPGKIDLTWLKDRQAICKKYSLGMRIRINSNYAGGLPKWYKGDLWQNAAGQVPVAIPSIADERFWEHYGPLCTAIAKEFKGEDMLYNAFIGVHAELKYSDWWSYDPSHIKLWQEAIKKPRPEWLARVVGDDVELPEKPPVPEMTKGSPDTDPANLAVIAFREWCWRRAIERFTEAIRAGDQSAEISSPLGESFRRFSAQFSNHDYWGLTRGSNQVVHSYDFFWHSGSTPLWHVRAVLDTFKGITGLPVNFEFDTLLTIRQFGYTDQVVDDMMTTILDSGCGIKIANMSYINETPSTFEPLRFAGEQCASGKYKQAVPMKPEDTVLLLFSKWANYCYREETEWLHDAQFGMWKLLYDLDVPVRVICEDNLGEDLSNYRGIVFAFSPLDLMPKADQEAIRKTNLPIIADVMSTPRLRPDKVIALAGDAGKFQTQASLAWDSIQNLSGLKGYKAGMQGDGKPFILYKPKSVVFGFPLGYYYLNGADQARCCEIMKFAITKAGMSRP